MVASAALVGASAPCSCPEVAALRQQVAAMQSLVQTMSANDVSQRLDFLESVVGKAMEHQERVNARAVSASGNVEQSSTRRLSAAPSTFVSVQSKHVHEFPSGHSCGAVGGYMAYLPLKADGTASFAPSPSDTTGDYTLATVANDWRITQLDRFPAPLKIVHDTSCASAPTMALQLNASAQSLSISGALLVNGVDVDASLSTLLEGTWQDIPFNTNSYQVSSDDTTATPQYMVRNGFVYLRGSIQSSGGGNFNSGDGALGPLPTTAHPTRPMMLLGASHGGNSMFFDVTSDGYIRPRQSGHSNNFFLDGVFYAL